MGKHLISPKAICPYYKHEDPQVIYCLGVKEESVLHVAFSNKTNAHEYKHSYCQKSYDKCPLYSMLDNLYL